MRPLIALALLLLASPLASAQECPDYNADPGRLTELEESASRGALEQAQLDCLEQSYQAATVQTTKDKISRVLLVDAYAYKTSWWAELVKRHLEEVDRSDPNIVYLYTFYLYNSEAPDYEEVIKWADVALERRQVWTGALYTHRSYKLLEARTYAAYQLWKAAEESHSPEVETLRNRAKTYAREWLDFARSSGKDSATAEEMCVQVASRQACGLTSGGGVDASE